MYSIVDSEVWQAPVQTEWYANEWFIFTVVYIQ